MGINTKQLIELIIQPTLKDLGLYSLAAEQLLAGTCAQESGMGTYLKQVGVGPALGIYQCEPATHKDIWKNYVHLSWSQERLRLIVNTCCLDDSYDYNGKWPDAEMLVWSLKYATTIARIHYLRVKEPLPPANDIPALAAYWKKYYNTSLGKGKETEFIANWNKHCASYYGGK